MRIMTMEKLQELLDKHAKWLNGDVGGVRADLRGVDLWGANLINVDLQCANLRHANLQSANLQHANLQGANLYCANLYGANLGYADLQDVDLQRANLCDADLQYADLRNVNLQRADLQRADLYDANLRGANLRDAILSWVNWHAAKNIRVYVAGLQSSRENAQLTYIPSLDVATTGCWQGSWQETIEQIHSVYDEGTRECKAYDLAIEYIENQMELDGAEDE